MKVKDLERTANVAWSPKDQSPIMLAAGTAAQQLDASFSTNAALEIYSLNLAEPGLDMKLECTSPSEQRFHKIIWGSYESNLSSGTIIAGCDSGLIKIFDASKLLKGENGLIREQNKHTGPVHALDFNPFQHNLFATGASESEIFIWDMNNPNTPMTPGSKSQPLEDVLSVAWNRQVQHILASTFASKCVIWDLRKNEPIIKLTDTVSRVRWKVVAWHPEVATQLCLASEEDHSPIIQIWDLRFATSPLKTLENHQRGVLSLAWCADDPDLLVSCGKDNRIICWNPNSDQQSGEVLSEIAKTNQWNFDVAWCPKNPAIIACPSFDGHISVYSLMGGTTQQFQTSNKIADSFPGMDDYVQAPVPQVNAARTSVDLSKPPKWLKRLVGARFGFGGKLITFENDKAAVALGQTNVQEGEPILQVNRSVQISQVITEPELVQKSSELEQALEYGNFADYCETKAHEQDDQHKKYIWNFLKANFEENPRAQLLNLLGYRIEDVNEKLSTVLGKDRNNEINGLTDQLSGLNRIEDFELVANSQAAKTSIAPFKIRTGEDTEGLITQALLLGNVEAAVELCFKAKRFADAIIIAMTGGSELLAKTQEKYLAQSVGAVSSLISGVATEDWGFIINNCDISSWKEALAATLTHASDEDLPSLCEQLGNRLESENRNNSPNIKEDAQLCYICSGSFEKLVNSWSGNALNSTQDLQELVELVTFLQKAVERQGRQVQVSGALADLLSRYASLLASQGNLQTALNYLGLSTDEKVVALRERLTANLDQKPASAKPVRQPQSRRSSQRQSFTNYTQPSFPAAPSYSTPPSQFNANATTEFGTTQHNFNTGLPSNTNYTSQPWMPANNSATAFNQPPRTFSPVPSVPTQPPRPPSTNASLTGSSSSGLPSRKYLLDPSVSSNQFGSFPRGQPIQHIPPFQNVSQNMNTSQSSAPGGPIGAVPNPSLNPVPLIPASPYGNGFAPPLPPPPTDTAQEAAHFVYANSPAAPGWNDPPLLHRSLKSQRKSEPHQEPITHPLYGATPVQSLPPNNGYGDAGLPPQQFMNAPLHQESPQMFQPTPQSNFGQMPTSYNPGGYNENAVNSGTINQKQVPTQRVEKPQAVAKTPIPEEHIHMQTVFDELRNQCSCAANNPQTKRKLEDVGRKLETLYDLLREYKLSSNMLTSLHQLVQMVQNGNYTGGLSLHTQLVSGPDFSQIASFMPGLKVLLQCALQLQVYLR